MILTPKHTFLRLSHELEEVCKPLELFNIHHFTYLKQYDDGSRIGLSNKPQWIEDYYNLHLFESSLFEGTPSNYQEKFDIWFGDYDLDVYKHGRLYYNTSHSITVTQPTSDACEFYLFATSPEHPQSINFLANNMDIIYHFILYFKDRCSQALKNAQKDRLIITDEKISSNSTFNSHNMAFSKDMLNKKLQFIKNTHVYKIVIENSNCNDIKLTNREIDCIFYLLNSKTAAETAELMCISRRTVETYLENLKNKFNCANKSNLLSELKRFKFLLFAR